MFLLGWVLGSGDAGSTALVRHRAGSMPPPWPEEARLFGSDQAHFWRFGEDVALDGSTAIVGANGANIGGQAGQGAAYIFVLQNGLWVEQARLTASDGAVDDDFGESVAIDADTAVVGASLVDIEGQGSQGAAYVFTRSGNDWTEVQKLVASDGAALDRFGSAVAVEGDAIIVGAPSAEGAGGRAGCQGSGAAYAFVRDGSVWSESTRLFDPDGLCADQFGNDVELQGNTLLLGAYSANIDGGANHGAAYVYIRIGDVWVLEQQLLASDGRGIDQFGYSVALDRDIALIGARQKTIGENVRQGAAYVFRRTGTTWTEEQRLTASDGQPDGFFGIGADLLGGVALIGAEFTSPGENGRGVVYEFRDQAGTWIEIQRFAAPIGQGIDAFGRAISLTEDHLLVGNPDNFSVLPQGGTAWIFGRPTVFADGFESGDTSVWGQTVP